MRSRERRVWRVVSPAVCAAVLAAASACVAAGCGSFSSDVDPSTSDGGGDGDAMAEGGPDAPGSEGSVGSDGGPDAGPRRLYVVGGEIVSAAADAGAQFSDKAFFATQLGDGSLTPWAETKPLFFVHGNTAVATAGAVVALGGEKRVLGGDTAVAFTSRAHVFVDGTLDTWTPTRDLPAPVYFHASLTVNGRVYVIGGSEIGTGATASVQFATIATDGVIGAWTAAASLPGPRTRVAAATDGTHLFVVGGTPGSGCEGAVLVGTMGPDGNVATWKKTGDPVATISPAAVVFANKLYVLGGFDCQGGTSARVESADIQGDGTLSAFTPRVSLPKPRSGLGAVVVGSYLYAVGGDDGNGPVPDVDVATLDTNGDYDTWRNGGRLPSGRSLFGFAAY